MKKNILSLCLALAAMCCHAENIILVPTNVKVERADRNVAIGMTLPLAELKVKSNQSVTLTPVITSPSGERKELPSITVAGRSRYYTLRRENAAGASNPQFYLYSNHIEPLQYATLIPFSSWMEQGVLSIETDIEGCCSENLSAASYTVETLNLERPAFAATYLFATPKAEAVKVRQIEGKAYVDFKVNQTVILPDFGHNPGELAKIRQSIDAVRDNADTRITSLSITGYASPEGSYENNQRLAKGRTESLASYVRSLYSFPGDLIRTSWVAEDWEGVETFLKDNPSFENRDAILAIVDSDLEPDAKNDRIMRTFPVAYRYMLENVYPALRHSDYKVEYTVRSYTTVEEIAEVFSTRPGDLSLQELFVLAESMPEGSPEYTDVYETAARLFPTSEEASLNAALAGMKRGDLEGAARHMTKAGNSPKAIYGRALLAVLKGDLKAARLLFEEAQHLGITEACEALQSLSILEAE